MIKMIEKDRILHGVPMRVMATVLSVLLGVSTLSACSLAQPEREENTQNADKFVGFHVVIGQRNPDRSAWTDYGEDDVFATQYGNLSIPNQVLFGTYQPESGEWIFEGLPGYNAFVTNMKKDDFFFTSGYAGLQADVKIAYDCNVSVPTNVVEDALALVLPQEPEEEVSLNEDDNVSLSGTVYVPKTGDDLYATCYNVFETEDGRIYLDGSGNSSSSIGDSGFGMSSKMEHTIRENGKEVLTTTTEVAVTIECVAPCVSLTVREYDDTGAVVAVRDFDAVEREVTLAKDTTWCVIEEIDTDGTVTRTAQNVADAFTSSEGVTKLQEGFFTKEQDDTLRLHWLYLLVDA